MICLSNNESTASKVLSSKPLIYIGMSSYAIYLYHQPLFSFARLKSINDPEPSLLIALITGSFIIGFIMYELMKDKIYDNFQLCKNKGKHKNICVMSAVIGCVNVPIIVRNGLTFDFHTCLLMVNHRQVSLVAEGTQITHTFIRGKISR